MATPPDSLRPGRRRARRTRALVIGVALCALLAGAVPFFESAADAVPPLCPDGTPPPCDIPDPTTSTTRPTGTTIVTNPAWTTRVNVLDQSPVPVAKPVVGSWGRAGTPYSTPINPVVWSDHVAERRHRRSAEHDVARHRARRVPPRRTDPRRTPLPRLPVRRDLRNRQDAPTCSPRRRASRRPTS